MFKIEYKLALNECFNQAVTIIPLVQNELESSWDKLVDQKMEYENRKAESGVKKKQLNSTQTEENAYQVKKKDLVKQLKKQESELHHDQKRFNKTGKRLENLYDQLEKISKIKTEPENNSLSNLFKAYNSIQASRINRRISDYSQKKVNLSQQIKLNQDTIKKTSFEIEHQQKQLEKLQVQNLAIRNEIDELLQMLYANGLEIQQTEGRIDKSTQYLENVAKSFVDIASESIRQQTLYKKSLVTPLDDLDYQKFIEEANSSKIAEIQNRLALSKDLAE